MKRQTTTTIASILTAGSMLCATQAWAQVRPLQTEPAFTSPAGSIRIEAGGEVIGGAPNPLTARERTLAAAPIFRLILSPADNVELDVVWPALITAFQDPDFGDESDWGDVNARVKVRFVRGRGSEPTLAFRLGVTLPETRLTRGLGPDALRTRAELLVSGEKAGSRWHANVGMAIQDDAFRPHSQRDYLTFGVAFEQRLGQRAVVLAEVAGQSDGEVLDASKNEARLGLRLPTGGIAWDVALRRGLGWASGRWGVTLGASFAVRCPGCGRAPVHAE